MKDIFLMRNTDFQLSYRYELSYGKWSTYIPWIGTSGPGLQHVFTNLSPNKRYQFQIRAKCFNAYSQITTGNFTTLNSYSPDEIGSRNSSSAKNEIHSIQLIPNPANDKTTIFVEGFSEISKSIHLFDLYGKLIYSVSIV
ncbi:MAG: fibronectin type III domain-containing protein [Saprospiraceae bacterium]|nr:fibronectin type III domain-containing protein [Saprospiraceae bacterium]MBK8296826.1 fibronectin type III domain-containing protein [Saprospiraceae bacterium]